MGSATICHLWQGSDGEALAQRQKKESANKPKLFAHTLIANCLYSRFFRTKLLVVMQNLITFAAIDSVQG